MRILITNSTLALRGGTEAYVQDLAAALKRAGHDVAAYSNIVGEVGADLGAAGVPVVSDLAEAPWEPDVIHGHHHLETMTALLHFPRTPAILVSHGWTNWLSAGLTHPRVAHHVAVDGLTRDALVRRQGLPPDRVHLVPNFIDLDRFRPRGPLPARIGRAAVFSHYAQRESYVPFVEAACARRGIALDVLGYGVGRPVRHPEAVLGHYDLVFAKGRAGLEALVMGCSVIVCDAFGMGPWVSRENVATLRTLEGNFLDWFQRTTADRLVAAIDRFDAVEAMATSAWARHDADADRAVPILVDLYTRAMATCRTPPSDAAAESRATAAYLSWVSRYVKERLVERDPMAGLAVRIRNRLARIPILAPTLLRVSSLVRRRIAR